MKLEVSSEVFSIYSPDGCYVLDGLIDRLEESANEWHAEQKEIIDTHPVLFPDMKGRLWKPNLDWMPGTYEIEYDTFLDVVSQYLDHY